MRQESADAKKRSNGLKDDITSLSLSLEDKYAVKKRLQGQIVQSPDRMRREMSDATQTLDSEQQEARQAERHARDVAARLVAATEAAEEVKEAMQALQEVRQEGDKYKAALQSVNEKKTHIAALGEELQEYTATQDDVTRNTQRLEQKLAGLRQQGKRRGMELQKALEQLQRDLIDSETDKRAVAKKVEKASAEAQKLQRQIDLEASQQREEVLDMARVRFVFVSLQMMIVLDMSACRRINEWKPS